MKVCLVNPPSIYAPQDEAPTVPMQRNSNANTFPVGLAMIGAVARSKGHNVVGVDMPYLTYEQTLAEIVRSAPDVVGMSCWTGTHRLLARLSADLKAALPGVRVVWGGHHATLFWRQCLDRYPIDAAVLGEGEFVFPALLDEWCTNRQADLPGLAYRRAGEIVWTGPPQRIDSLDGLPFPAFNLFHLASDDGSEVKYGARRPDPGAKRIVLLASRGCPFKCTFCVDGKHYSKAVNRDVARIIDEIEVLKSNYNVALLEFSDMTFTLSTKRTAQLCEEILRRGVEISWQAMSRVNVVSAELLSLMRKAGCYSISFGVETGSPELLRRIKKQITRQEIIEAFQLASAAGLSTNMLLMVGNPGETDRTIADTIDLLYLAKPTQIDVSIYQVYPGSATYMELKQRGYIDDSFWLDHDAAPYYEGEQPLSRLKYWQQKMQYHHSHWPRERGWLLGGLRRAVGI